MLGVLWAYEGWQYVTFSAGEARDPQRTFPRALLIGTAVLIGIYLLANVAYVAALGPAGVQGSQRVAADSVSALFGPAAGKLIAAVILVSMFSAANGITLTAPRLFFSMARDGSDVRRATKIEGAAGWATQPEWTPDGRIVFANCLARDVCYVGYVDADGTHLELPQKVTGEAPQVKPTG